MSNLLLFIYALISSAGLVFVKLGSKLGAPVTMVDKHLAFNLNFYNVSGVILYGISFVLYTILLSKKDLSYIAPMSTAMVYVFIFAASYFLFHEQFTGLKIIAIVTIVIGAILLNLK